MPVLTNLEPFRVVHGGRLWVHGDGFPTPTAMADDVTIGGVPARISFASPDRMAVVVPDGVEGDDTPVKVSWAPGATLYAHIGRVLATGLHQVDNPVVDRDGGGLRHLLADRAASRPRSRSSASRRSRACASPSSHGLVNATSMAFGPDGKLYVSSRFEGRVYRVHDDGQYEVIGSDLGIARGLAFAPDGSLFVGDRSGTIFRIDSKGRTETVATLPGSVAAFHLAMGPDGWLYVSAPTLSTYDLLRRVDASGRVEVLDWVFGRPQGLAFDANGVLHVVEALAGSSGVYALEARPSTRTGAVGAWSRRARVLGRRRAVRRLERHPLRLRVALTLRLHSAGHVPTVCAKTHRRSRRHRRGAIAEARARRRRPDHARDRRGDRRRHLRRDRHRGGRAGGGRTARSSATAPGPALVFSFLLLGGACALAALCYAELASMIPQAGSAYAYSYATLGELVAWIIGWDLILEYAVGNVAVAISWGDYFTTLLRGIGIHLPAWLTHRLPHRAAQLESRRARRCCRPRRTSPASRSC